jgi:hypothetical protein
VLAVKADEEAKVDDAYVVVILFAVISPVVDKEVIVVVARDTVPVAVREPVVRLEVEALERLV